MVCSDETEMFEGRADCVPNTCVGSPALPTGYETEDANCGNMLYPETCRIACSEGYENLLGTSISVQCTADTSYNLSKGDGSCTESRCYAFSPPGMLNVADSSSCIGIASRESCSPVCDDGYQLVEPINCTLGSFEMIPVVCVSDADAEALERVEVLLVEIAFVAGQANSGIMAEWAGGGTRAPMQSAFGDVLGLRPEQVYLLEMKDLNSDSASGLPARLSTGEEGLFVKLCLQLYPIDDRTAIEGGLAGLGTGNFTRSFVSFLQEAGVAVPAGLRTAAVVAGAPATALQSLPVARWAARTEWSVCSTTCGEGEVTRDVDCLTSNTNLCNANAPPDFTQDSFEPSSLPCRSYIQCPYDWTCPSGPDEETGEGCEVQAGCVSAAIAFSSAICCFLSIWYVRNMCRQPVGGTFRVQVKGGESRGTTIDWTRDNGFSTEDGVSKTRLKYSLGDGLFAFFQHEREAGRAILTPSSGEPIEHVDLNLGGEVEFELEVRVRTLATNALLVAKVYSEVEPMRPVGKAKGLLIRGGVAAWQIGKEFLLGSTRVADGLPHDISVLYDAEQDEYVLKVDGEEDARGFRGSPDAPECKLVLGSPSAPRDERCNEVLSLLDQLRVCGVEVLPLEEQSDEVLFDGDFDRIIWKERQWIKGLDKMEWVSYRLHVDTEDAMVKRATSKAPRADETVIMIEPEAAPEPKGTATAYAVGDVVEYWSKTTNSWLGARVMDIRGQPYHSEEHGMNVFTYDLFVMAARQRVPNADMKNLRLPFSVSEKVSVFSKKHGDWYPAIIHAAPREARDPRLGYDVALEHSELKTEMLEHARQLKAQKELQGNQYEERPGRGRRRRPRRSSDQDVAGSAELGSVPQVPPLGGDALTSSGPAQAPRLPIGQEDGNPSSSPESSPMQEEDLPVLKSMPGKRLRRRFDRGTPVQVYLGAEQGFLTGTVVGPASGPEPRDIVPPPSPSPSPRSPTTRSRIRSPEASPSLSPLRSSDNDDPHGVDVRPGAGTAEVEIAVVPQRHATATVSIHGRSGPDRTYPEYMLRPLIERRRARSWI
ncbi:unnamed protein product [Prorocentrum cordatum]|uniref:Uncharacterized protein n=1 Tax=Prorocentrum cordatum TaxID=2364126 RepID=A0ABN9P896_9DINO|nr:unnamed protein product [Polarella glacialis]